MLLDFIAENYDEYSEHLGYTYNFELTGDNSNADQIYSLSYDPENDSFTVFVCYDYGVDLVSYYFAIYPEYDDTFAMYFRDKYVSGEYISICEANTSFYCDEFGKNYNYTFDEYTGETQKNDAEICISLHNAGLYFLNLIFGACGSSYTVYDLGYTSF